MKDPVAGKIGVRQAIAYLVDREALVRNVYSSTASPLYSIIPSGITAHSTAFFDQYGEQPPARQGEGGPALGGHHRQGEADPVVHAEPLRTVHRRGVEGDRRAAQRERPVRRGCEVGRVQAVREGHRGREVRRLREGLGPRLPGPGQLHPAVLRQGQRAVQQLHQQADHRRDPPGDRGHRRPLRDGRSTSPSSRTSSPTRSRSCRCGRASSTRWPARASPAWSGPWTRRRCSASGSSRRADVRDRSSRKITPPSASEERRLRAAGRAPAHHRSLTGRRAAPARSRTRTPPPAPGRAAPASSAHAPHAS